MIKSIFLGLLGLLLSSHTWAFSVIIQNNGGTSTNGSFVGNVWTPTADSVLDYADLNAQLIAANTTIDTNGPGTITIVPLYNYSGTVDRVLTLTATSNISIGGISSNSNELSVTATSSSGNISVTAAGINTEGGDVNLNSNGNVSINSSGIRSDGGQIILSSTTGTVSITDGGMSSSGGNIEITANLDITSNSGGITSSGGNVTLQSLNGGISASNSGIQGGNGLVSLTVLNDIALSGGAIGSGGSSIEGANLTVSDGGINTNGGDIVARLTGDVTISSGGASSNGGNISITSAQTIFVNPGITIESGGGDITLTAETAIEVADSSPISSAPGTGGTLTVDPGVTIGNEPPELGAGNISLLIRAFNDPTAIPTLSKWGLLITMLLFVLISVVMSRRKQA